jgi:hypothetical protein
MWFFFLFFERTKEITLLIQFFSEKYSKEQESNAGNQHRRAAFFVSPIGTESNWCVVLSFQPAINPIARFAFGVMVFFKLFHQKKKKRRKLEQIRTKVKKQNVQRHRASQLEECKCRQSLPQEPSWNEQKKGVR